MEITIIVSSVGGNTKKMADYIRTKLEADGFSTRYLTIKEAIESRNAGEDLGENIVMCFWCRRSTMDELSLELLSKLENKNILALGTMTGRAYEDYGKKVAGNVEAAINDKNTCIAVHSCQGHTPMSRIEPKRNLPKDAPRYINDERYARYISLMGRPNEDDLQMSWEFVARNLIKY